MCVCVCVCVCVRAQALYFISTSVRPCLYTGLCVCMCVCVCACEWTCFFCACVRASYLPPSGPGFDRFSVKKKKKKKNHSHAVAGLPLWKAAPGRNSVLLLPFPLRCSKKFLASQLEAQDLFLTYMGVLGLMFPSKKQKSKETHLKFALSHIQQGYSITALQ